MVATGILAKVEANRLQKAVEGLVSGAYTITLASQSEAEICGFVANGDSKQYGVVLSEERAFCSCPDAIYRKGICKHAVALALFAIRQPRPKQGESPQVTELTGEAKPYDLKLGKTRPGWSIRSV
jgi:predicted nucleic acid-binding Zn finger protein